MKSVVSLPKRACARGVLSLALLMAGATTQASADSVILRDGRKFAGTLREIRDGKLVLSTDFAGDISIPWSTVAGIETLHPVRLWLRDGRRLNGVAGPGAPGSILVREEGQDLPVEVPLADVERLNEPGSVWAGRLSLTSKIEDGNSDSTNLFLTAELSWETDDLRALVRGNGGVEEKGDVLTERNAYALAKLDGRFSPASYGYLSDEYKVDRFEDLVFRNVASVGLGYHVVTEKGLDIRLEAGPAFISEELRDGPRDTWMGGRVSGHFRLELPIGLELRDDATIYPNFERWVDWQFHNEATLSTRLGAGWNLTLSVISDWDNEPAAGKVSHDNKYVAGIGYQF